jgi:hypothetical protein
MTQAGISSGNVTLARPFSRVLFPGDGRGAAVLSEGLARRRKGEYTNGIASQRVGQIIGVRRSFMDVL